ncbi:hypothetical protein KSP40_PGU009710 [Platanthera guangdongensis]|uniref:Uncharacterized protein n=1 Tax=Platanthera guangdongensis TaxID=2320717 RepID=A0ABR2MHS6_9ASPA
MLANAQIWSKSPVEDPVKTWNKRRFEEIPRGTLEGQCARCGFEPTVLVFGISELFQPFCLQEMIVEMVLLKITGFRGCLCPILVPTVRFSRKIEADRTRDILPPSDFAGGEFSRPGIRPVLFVYSLSSSSSQVCSRSS